MSIVQHATKMMSKSDFDAMSMIASFISIIIPVNPPKIVTITDDDITISLNEMDRWVPYVVLFQRSRYLIWKNDDDALVMIDADMLELNPDDR